jgi:hypothetical protein
MRRLMLLAVSILVVVSMAVSPALAHDRDGDGWDEDFGFWIFVPVFVTFDADFDGIDDSSDCDFVFCDDFHEKDFFDNCEWEWSWVFEEWEIEC